MPSSRLLAPTVAASSSSKLLVPGSSRFASSDSQPKEMTVRDALNSAMEEEMLRDDNVFLLGEEVARCEWLRVLVCMCVEELFSLSC